MLFNIICVIVKTVNIRMHASYNAFHFNSWDEYMEYMEYMIILIITSRDSNVISTLIVQLYKLWAYRQIAGE